MIMMMMMMMMTPVIFFCFALSIFLHCEEILGTVRSTPDSGVFLGIQQH